MKSRTKNLFNAIPVKTPRKNHFDLSHDVKLSCNMGDLVPTLAMEVVPGDVINISHQQMVRLAPTLAPIMHRVNITHHTWFVPFRILWESWQEYIAPKTADAVPPAFPYHKVPFNSSSKLLDYLGIPKNENVSYEPNISAMYCAAYQCIYNEWYRDQNLISEVAYQLVDGDNNTNTLLRNIRKRAWEHDYFTACLPWAQKGEAVDIPFGNFQDVAVLSQDDPGADTAVELTGTSLPSATPNNQTVPYGVPVGDVTTNLYAETSQMSSEITTINALRLAESLQKLLEKFARGGSRYTEVISNIFDVKSSDKRLQRPEYITGSKSPIIISEVLNTTGTENAPQGSMAGHGISIDNSRKGKFFVEEHGIVMSIMSILPTTAYQQGIHRQFSKINDKYEFYWPDLAHIGEQAVLNQEIFAYVDATTDQETFGYIPRYSEYKYMPSRVCGQFRDSLDFWHMGRKFDTPPALNEDFVSADPTYRIFAVTSPDEDHLWCHILHNIHAVRPMPVFGTPTL